MQKIKNKWGRYTSKKAEIVTYYQRYGLIKTLSKFNLSSGTLFGYCYDLGITIKRTDRRTVDEEKKRATGDTFLSTLPANEKEYRELNYKPNKKRQETYESFYRNI